MHNYDDLLEKGYRLIELNQSGEALQAFRQAAELRPEEKEPLVQLAFLFQQLGDADGAIGLLQKAADLDPENAYVLLNLGLIHYEEKRWVEAEHYLQEAVHIIERGTADWRQQLAEHPHKKSEEILSQCDQLDQTAAEARALIAEIEGRDSESDLDSTGLLQLGDELQQQ